MPVGRSSYPASIACCRHPQSGACMENKLAKLWDLNTYVSLRLLDLRCVYALRWCLDRTRKTKTESELNTSSVLQPFISGLKHNFFTNIFITDCSQRYRQLSDISSLSNFRLICFFSTLLRHFSVWLVQAVVTCKITRSSAQLPLRKHGVSYMCFVGVRLFTYVTETCVTETSAHFY